MITFDSSGHVSKLMVLSKKSFPGGVCSHFFRSFLAYGLTRQTTNRLRISVQRICYFRYFKVQFTLVLVSPLDLSLGLATGQLDSFCFQFVLPCVNPRFRNFHIPFFDVSQSLRGLGNVFLFLFFRFLSFLDRYCFNFFEFISISITRFTSLYDPTSCPPFLTRKGEEPGTDGSFEFHCHQ